MDSHKTLFSLLCHFLVLLLSGETRLQVDARLQHDLIIRYHPQKLFVFGDSYVDTGNTRKAISESWKEPYGITFPGKPTGRWSDGRVLSDYIANYLRLKSPVPYKLRKLIPQHMKYGVNFAFGGTGVFDTSFPYPNMTIQIDFLKQLIKDKVYTTSNIRNSVAYVSIAGNDYNQYLATNGSLQGFPSFISSVVHQTTINLIRIQKLGVKKIVVGGLHPIGCLPQIIASSSSSSFQRCNSTSNDLAILHNNLLNKAVTKLNHEKNASTTFLFLDLYGSFMSVLNHPSNHNIKNPLKPCCVGVSSKYSCGSVDANNVKKYTVCDKPKSAFFWDLLHPSEAGWSAVYNKLQTKSALRQIFY